MGKTISRFSSSLFLVLFAIVFISGCVKQGPTITTTTTTNIPATTITTESNLPSNKLLQWTKESGARITGGISSSTIIKDNEYWMYYTARGIELATSTDGLNFVGKGTVVSSGQLGSEQEMVTNPAVFKLLDGRYRMIYEGSRKADGSQTDRKLYSAVSSDGLTWTKEDGVRFFDYGDGKPGEIFTSVPDIVRLPDNRLRMYYTRGMTSAAAISIDEGLTWTKEKNLDLGNIAVDLDLVELDDGTYKLFYTTFESEWAVGEQFMMSASSADGLNFVTDSGRRLEPANEGGLITDPDVIKVVGGEGGYRLYYGEFSSPSNMQSNILSAFSAG